jgi:alkanesulfonate monooxygenase SsuD/methylene tetrahydromethanopterin reductase-like flavin-dependent oxidoreductase (luciferase family)
MKFYISTAFRETKEAIEIAKAADDLGYDGVGIPDHIINLESLETRTRIRAMASADGSRLLNGPTRGCSSGRWLRRRRD